MKRAPLILFLLLVAVLAAGQSLGPGIRWGPPSGMVPVNIVGVPGQEWLPPPPAAATFSPITEAWAYWDMTNVSTPTSGFKTVYDLSGNSRDLVGFAGAIATDGILFNGLGGGSGCGYLLYQDPSPATYTAFTIMLRGRPTAFSGYTTGPLISWYEGAAGAPTDVERILYAPLSAPDADRFYYYYGAQDFTGDSVNGLNLVTTAFRCDGATMTLFVDGVQTDQVAQPVTVSMTTYFFAVGSRWVSGGSYGGTTGYIRKVAVYTRALSDAEITGTVW